MLIEEQGKAMKKSNSTCWSKRKDYSNKRIFFSLFFLLLINECYNNCNNDNDNDIVVDDDDSDNDTHLNMQSLQECYWNGGWKRQRKETRKRL